MRLFFKSSYFLRNGRGIPVIDGANEILKKHVGRLELHIVTSRQNILEEHTRDWVEANFPNIFKKLHFGNHHGTQGEVRSKPDLCRAIGAVMMIDDNVRYATQCAEAGIRTCLFGERAQVAKEEEFGQLGLSLVHSSPSPESRRDRAPPSVSYGLPCAGDSVRWRSVPDRTVVESARRIRK